MADISGAGCWRGTSLGVTPTCQRETRFESLKYQWRGSNGLSVNGTSFNREFPLYTAALFSLCSGLICLASKMSGTCK
jgi:hypothetical protein